MSSPSNPTLASIVAEGLFQANESHPDASTILRYQNEVMEQLKNEIWKACRQPKIMQTFAYGVLVPGQSRYSCPADFSSDMSASILWGSVQGTAQGGSSTTLILEASATQALSDVLGKEILIVGGTGIASASQIIGLSNNSGTITVTVTPAFASTPDATSKYMIIDQMWPIKFDHISEYYRKSRPASLDRPRYAYPIGDEDYDEFILDVPPDSTNTYGIKMFYYGNLMKTDLNSNLMSRLYLEWRNFWIQGIKAKHLMLNDDTRGPGEWNAWMQEVQKLVVTATYGTDLHEFAQVVTDY
jgi:hypothetical protein